MRKQTQKTEELQINTLGRMVNTLLELLTVTYIKNIPLSKIWQSYTLFYNPLISFVYAFILILQVLSHPQTMKN